MGAPPLCQSRHIPSVLAEEVDEDRSNPASLEQRACRLELS